MRLRPYIAMFETNTEIRVERSAVPRRHAAANRLISPGPKTPGRRSVSSMRTRSDASRATRELSSSSIPMMASAPGPPESLTRIRRSSLETWIETCRSFGAVESTAVLLISPRICSVRHLPSARRLVILFATALIGEARTTLGFRRHRDRGEDAEVGQRTAPVDSRRERHLVRANLRGCTYVDDEPTDLTRSDERRRLHRRIGPIRERQRRLSAVDPLVPARRTGVAERDDPLHRPVRPRGRIRALRFEGGAIRAEGRKLECRTRECGRRGRCGLEHLVEPRVELAPEIGGEI